MANIIIVEPLCYGNEHDVVNAGLIATARLAYPDAAIEFYAEAGHCRAVSDVLAREGITGIKIKCIAALPHGKSGFCVLLPALMFCWYIVKQAQKADCKVIIFSAIDEATLLCLKIMVRLQLTKLQFIVIAHSVLQRIQHRPPRLPWNHLIWFRNVLRFLNHRQIKIVVPGESILRIVAKDMPSLVPYLYCLELAYFFPKPDNNSKKIEEKAVRFGFLGMASRRKGIEAFYSLAEQVTLHNEKTKQIAEFWILGTILEESMRVKMPDIINAPIADRFVSREELFSIIQPMHFAIFPYQTKEYQLVASAAFLDALACVKPIIALTNPYFEYYFEKIGNIGFLCETVDEMVETILKVLNNKDRKLYMEFCEAIIKGRDIFSPFYLKLKLKEIIGANGCQ